MNPLYPISFILDPVSLNDIISFTEEANFIDVTVAERIDPLTGEVPEKYKGMDLRDVAERRITSITYTVKFKIVGQLALGTAVLLQGFEDTKLKRINNLAPIITHTEQVQPHGELAKSIVTAVITI